MGGDLLPLQVQCHAKGLDEGISYELGRGREIRWSFPGKSDNLRIGDGFHPETFPPLLFTPLSRRRGKKLGFRMA